MNNSIKKVTINLQSPQKYRKTHSPSPPNKKIINYNVSVQQLKKTVGNDNVCKSIQMQHQRKMNEVKKAKNKQNMIQTQAMLDSNGQSRLTMQEFMICKNLYSMLDKDRKNYTQAKDLAQLEDNRLRNIVRVVYFRKERNRFFDFVFGLWDSQSLPYLVDYYSSQV